MYHLWRRHTDYGVYANYKIRKLPGKLLCDDGFSVYHYDSMGIYCETEKKKPADIAAA